MIRSKCFFRSTIFLHFSLTHKEEEVWPDGTHPMLFAESSCACMPFRPVVPFYSGKITIFVSFAIVVFFNIEKGVTI